MLNLIYGRAGSGKTEFVFSHIKELAEGGNSNIVLITPEQFSFISERRLLKDLGESRINCVSNLSFTRLSNEISRLYGGDNLPVLTKGARAVMMKKAIQTIQDSLVLFNKNALSNSFINSFLGIYDEMKSCRVFTKDILEAADNVEREILSMKLKDIALIISAYDALIEGEYYDSENELTRLYHKLAGLDYFCNKTVFIDGFSGFVAQEYKILEVVLSQAEQVYVTFCTDSPDSRDENSMFSQINTNIGILKDVAKKVGCEIKSETFLTENKRAQNSELLAVEKYAFSNKKYEIKEEPENIYIYSAKNICDECDNVSSQISKLLRNGGRAGDVTVICRDIDAYRKELQFSFEKYRIPYFNDERQSVSSQPLIMLVNFLLRTIIYSFKSEDIFSLLKTGLTALGEDEINALENYAYVWNINGAKWKKDFVDSPRGFSEELTDADKKALEELNSGRKYIIDIISKFKKRCSKANAEEICKAVYFALIELSADKKLKELAASLDKNGKSFLSLEQERIWNLLMEMLDKLALTGKSEIINIKEFHKLFSLMVANEDLGSLPSGLDNVQIGSADRIRCNNPKYVFLLGANEGVFPKSISLSGILTETDRRTLVNNNFKLYSHGKALNAQEMYYAYMAACSAREKLWVSYISGGEKNSESAIVRSITELFVNIKTNTFSAEHCLSELESDENAFEILASDYTENSEFIASLKEYFAGKAEYSSKLGAIEKLIDNDEISISDTKLATNLFKKDISLSATGIETYHKCPFAYFCRYGLGAKTLAKAEMDHLQRGTVIHYVLESIIKQKGNVGLKTLKDEEIAPLVNSILDDYLKNKLGDSSDFTERFKYQFLRLSKMIVFVVQRLRDEFSQSDFVAKAFEVGIGNTEQGAQVESKTFKLSDGGSIRIIGTVDRVDTFEQNGRQYIRVVDYKSRNKDFLISDVINGLNLQMLVYLFTLSESKGEFGGISSGVLYMHSAREVYSVNRSTLNKDIDERNKKEFLMHGIVLNDAENEIAKHMEKSLEGKYIPVVCSSDGGLTGSIVSSAELGAIAKKVDDIICKMGLELHGGRIAQFPAYSSSRKTTCENCEYGSVCKNRVEITQNTLETLKNSEAIEMIMKENENA